MSLTRNWAHALLTEAKSVWQNPHGWEIYGWHVCPPCSREVFIRPALALSAPQSLPSYSCSAAFVKIHQHLHPYTLTDAKQLCVTHCELNAVPRERQNPKLAAMAQEPTERTPLHKASMWSQHQHVSSMTCISPPHHFTAPYVWHTFVFTQLHFTSLISDTKMN